jgi:hypothetical protein
MIIVNYQWRRKWLWSILKRYKSVLGGLKKPQDSYLIHALCIEIQTDDTRFKRQMLVE